MKLLSAPRERKKLLTAWLHASSVETFCQQTAASYQGCGREVSIRSEYMGFDRNASILPCLKRFTVNSDNVQLCNSVPLPSNVDHNRKERKGTSKRQTKHIPYTVYDKPGKTTCKAPC